MRNKCIKKIKKAKPNHHKKVLNDNISKPNKFWSQIKNVFPGKWQSMANVSTDKHPSLNILSRFHSTMASKLKKSTDLRTDFTWHYTAKSPPKLGKLLDFRIFQYDLCKKSWNCYLARNPPVLTTYSWAIERRWEHHIKTILWHN